MPTSSNVGSYIFLQNNNSLISFYLFLFFAFCSFSFIQKLFVVPGLKCIEHINIIMQYQAHIINYEN